VLDHLPGKKRIYSSWQSLDQELRALLKGHKKIAMEYSPQIPYVSRVDGGTVDHIRSFGVEVVSSGDFLPHFTAVLSEEQIASQLRAASACDEIVQETWKWLASHLPLTESDVQKKILQEFKKRNLITDHGPIVAVNAHSADPHYETGETPIRLGDFLLIDLWAQEPGGVFGDITRVGVLAPHPTPKQNEVFHIVRKAQKKGVALIQERFKHRQRIEGWEVDAAVRSVIREAGYGAYFIHRTGHSIETTLHGSGAHMDDLEMHDVRPILPATCFSVEPGIYLPGEFGVRLEHDILIRKDGTVLITGGEQDKMFTLG
jgi:Xaa-Pro dipeptidase